MPLRRPALARPAVGPIRIGDVLLALVSYVPLLLTHRGKLGADTKAYLYLDPAKLMSKAPYLWDPSVGLGTVTHQNIGYLFPMGPYYWLMAELHVPDWIAQRLWFGSIIFLAGLGVRYLLRTLRWDGPGVTVAAFSYALSPYLLHYIYKHSVILLPFTALPWLVAFTARSLRQPGWRHPALFALVALASGGINATSLLLVLLAPGLWVVHAVFVEKELTFRAAIPPVLRIGLLSALTSLWWVAGLSIQGKFGINVLRFTETYRTVSDASTSAEIGRSLGYWFFYGVDTFGPWFKAAATMTTSLPALALSFAVPIVCVACGLWVRFRYRIFFVAVALVGLVVSVGSHPLDNPSPYGEVFKAFSNTESGLALRSTPRAIPLLALALAAFLGAGVAAASRRFPARRLAFAGGALLMVMANLSPLFTGRMIDPFLERPNDVPEYWKQVGKRLDAGDRATRALEIPGIEFANYRWGASVDPITPGLTDRAYAARELVPYGSNASANLMNAIDTPLQDRSFDPESYASILRMLSVGDLVVRNDLEYERFRTPRPRPLEHWMRETPGLGTASQFGSDAPNVATSTSPLLDDLELSTPDTDPDPHAVSVYPVQDPLPVLRTVPAERPTILSGDGEGVVSAAEAGALDPDHLLVYSGTVSNDRTAMTRLLDEGAQLVVTDTNRKAGRRWGTTKDNDGYTEMADETAPADPSDNRLDLFDGRGTAVQTVAIQSGGVTATASGYGNPLSFTPGDRAVNAVDGNLSTAWKVGAFSDVTGEWLQLELPRTGRPSTLKLVQPSADVNRWITKVRLTFDGRAPMDVELGDASRTDGQTIALGDRSFRTLRITVLETDRGVLGSYKGLSGVGFREATLGDAAPTVEVIRPPVDLLRAVGKRLADTPVQFVFRRRTAPADSGAVDEETRLVRQVDLPAAREAAVRGKFRIDPDAPDDRIDALLGLSGATITSSSGLRGDARSRASKAFDDDTMTAWQSRMSPDAGEWIQAVAPAPITATVSSVQVLADARHSVPTKIHFEVDGVAQPSISLPSVDDGKRGTVRTLRFDPVTLSGTTIRLVVDEYRSVTTPDWYTHHPVTLPVSIAGLGSDELHTLLHAASPGLAECRSDLLTVAGAPVPVTAGPLDAAALDEAERGGLVAFRPCDAASSLTLASGRTRVESVAGATTGLDVDQLVLDSLGAVRTTAPLAAPALRVTNESPIHYRVTPTTPQTRPYWLILGQSNNAGWHLSVGGKDLGPSTLVNGYANGWYIDPAKVGRSPRFEVEWTPQKPVWLALLLSGAGFLLCLVLALRPARASTLVSDHPLHPVGLSLLDAFGRTPDAGPIVIATLLAAVGTAVFVGPLWAVPAVIVTVAALRTDIGWRLLRFGTVGALGLVAAYVVVKQWRNDYPLDFDWPQHFEAVHSLGMFAYALLAIECMVEVLRAGWRREAGIDADI
ncbi:MAG: alpha-(1-_3)-arabinofuranosyltransferase family protein [Acidimicrobiales bacterium]